MKTILDTIIEQKRIEVSFLKRERTFKNFEESPFFHKKTISIVDSLRHSDFGIIAEIKRKSPSAGVIEEEIDLQKITNLYENYCASAISVLTDYSFFGGTENDLIEVKKYSHLPVLRKDFVIDEIQIFQAKSMGADAILLIAEVLTEQEILHFTILAQELGLEVICEFHEKNQLNKINDLVNIIGVNNRNLKNQTTSIQTSLEVIDFLPKDKIIISESGIKTREELQLLQAVGYNGALIGESILKSQSAILLKEFNSKQQSLIVG